MPIHYVEEGNVLQHADRQNPVSAKTSLMKNIVLATLCSELQQNSSLNVCLGQHIPCIAWRNEIGERKQFWLIATEIRISW